jgi:hypothetical protein
MTKNINSEKKSLRDKIYILLVMLGMLSIIYFIATSLRNEELKNIEFIKADYKITRGIITEKHTYKGNSIHVKYKVNEKIYEGIDGFNEIYDFKEGDSVVIKYSTTKPELMLTEFNDKFEN